MELLQLRYFLELAKHEHLPRVAEKMFVSPSAISSSISRLEDELGVQLFERVGRNIHLSPYGKIYYESIQRALDELDDGRKKLEDMISSSDTHLTMATTNPYIWSNPIHDFCKMYPHISFRTFSFDSIANGSKTPHDSVDLMIASPEGFSDPSWESALLFRDEIALAVPQDHPFAERTSIDLYEARNERFVNLPDSAFSRCCNNLCAASGFTPKSQITCDYTLRPKMAKSEGMVMLTTFNCKTSEFFQGMVFIPLENENVERNQAIFWPKGRYLSHPAQLFKDYIINLYKDYAPYQA